MTPNASTRLQIVRLGRATRIPAPAAPAPPPPPSPRASPPRPRPDRVHDRVHVVHPDDVRPASTPATHAAAVAGSRALAAAFPVAAPRTLSATRRPASARAPSPPPPSRVTASRTPRRFASRSQHPSCVFANPRPGSVQRRHGSTPAFAASARAPRAPRPRARDVVVARVSAADCIVVGSPRMCIATYGVGRSVAATAASMPASSVPAETSLMTSAPARAAAGAPTRKTCPR